MEIQLQCGTARPGNTVTSITTITGPMAVAMFHLAETANAVATFQVGLMSP